MKKYRVYNKSGFVEFTDLVQAQNYHSQFGIGDIEEIDLVSQFNIYEHKELIELSVDNLIEQTLQEYWYNSKGDVAINALDDESTWQNEAIQLSKWINSTYIILRSYLDTVNESNFQTVENFISSLPKFNI